MFLLRKEASIQSSVLTGVVSDITHKLLALSMLKGVGPATLRKITAIPGYETDSIELLAQQITAVRKAIAVPGAWDAAQAAAEQQRAAATAAGARIISAMDAEYPRILAVTRDDPFILYVKGVLAPGSSVAVVGTREPTSHGRLIAERVASYFVEECFSIVSGLARGCDTAAHQAALAAGGHTIAVLAHGLQTIAPSQNEALAQSILDAGGALVSQYPFGTEPMPAHFVQRDRTQAGLSQGTVMVQSDLDGGSLHASRASLRYGRWLAVPYPTERDLQEGSPAIQANLRLIEGTTAEKLALLSEQDPAILDRLITLRSKDDYAQCLDLCDQDEGNKDLVETLVRVVSRHIR